MVLMILAVLLLAVMVAAEWRRPRDGTIVLPAGGTYLGPSGPR